MHTIPILDSVEVRECFKMFYIYYALVNFIHYIVQQFCSIFHHYSWWDCGNIFYFPFKARTLQLCFPEQWNCSENCML